MDWNRIFISINALIAVTCGVMVVLHLLTRQNRQITDRLDDLSGTKQRDWWKNRARKNRMRKAEKKDGKGGLASLNDDPAGVHSRMLRAGIYSTTAPSTYAAVRLGCSIVAIMVAFLIGAFRLVDARWAIVMGLVLVGATSVLPGFWLDWMKKRRHLILRASLPDFLDLISTCLESGLSFEAALQRVSDELKTAHPTLAGEMRIVQREMEFGKSPDQALRNFAERSDLDVLRTLSTFVEQSRRFGSSMVETLRIHADTLRTQCEQRAEENAQRAAVKILFPTLLFIFPPILVVLAGPAAIQLQEKFAQTAEKDAERKPQ